MGKYILTFADQAILSFTNFTTSILLARVLNKKDYGIYIILLSMLLFIQSVQSAVITYPMATLGNIYKEYEVTDYFGALFYCQVIISLILVTAGLVFAFLFLGFGNISFLATCGLLFLSWQNQEFLRKMLLAKHDSGAAIINDAISYGLQLILIIVSFSFDILTLDQAILIMGLTSLLAVIYGLYQCKNYFHLPLKFKSFILDNWNFGKWLLAANTLTWTSSHAFNYLAAIFIGLQGPAILQACGNIMGPTNIILIGLENIIAPIAAQKYKHSGIPVLKRYLDKIALTGILGLIGYVLMVGFFSRQILDFLYKGTYNGYSHIIWLIAGAYVFSFIMRINAIGLRTVIKTKKIFWAYLISTIVMLVAGIPLVMFLSIEGAAIGSMLTAAITGTIVYLSFKSEIRAAQWRG